MNATEKTIYRTRPAKRKKRSWRDNPDRLIPGFRRMPRAESLKPTMHTTELAAQGDEKCRAIIDSWEPSRGWQHLVVVIPPEPSAPAQKTCA